METKHVGFMGRIRRKKKVMIFNMHTIPNTLRILIINYYTISFKFKFKIYMIQKKIIVPLNTKKDQGYLRKHEKYLVIQ